MFEYDRWQEIFDSLKRHKLRTAATALAVWWGIFMLVILLGAGNGLQNSFKRDFGDDAMNSIWLWGGQTTKNYKGFKAGRRIQFENKDYNAIKEKVEGVEYLTGRYFVPGSYLTEYDGKALSLSIRAVHSDYLHIENTVMDEGRYINDIDIKKNRKIAIVGKLSKEDLFGKEKNAIGEYITINKTKFQVVGVFSDTGGEREMRTIYLPITTVQKTFSRGERLHNIVLTVGDATLEESEAIGDNIFQELATIHNIDPSDKQSIYVSNNIEEFNRFNVIFTGIKFFIWFVGIGSIIAGVVGVSNIMLIIVKDRTKEIGIRKAMGATPRSIVGMIMQEAIFLTSIAGYLGLLMGFGVVYGIKTLLDSVGADLEFFHNPEVDFLSVVLALLFLIICGTLAGLVPALQAVRINPIEAMKS